VIGLYVLRHALHVPRALALGREWCGRTRFGFVLMTEHQRCKLQEGSAHQEVPARAIAFQLLNGTRERSDGRRGERHEPTACGVAIARKARDREIDATGRDVPPERLERLECGDRTQLVYLAGADEAYVSRAEIQVARINGEDTPALYDPADLVYAVRVTWREES
jgi:hypothetical protein